MDSWHFSLEMAFSFCDWGLEKSLLTDCCLDLASPLFPVQDLWISFTCFPSINHFLAKPPAQTAVLRLILVALSNLKNKNSLFLEIRNGWDKYLKGRHSQPVSPGHLLPFTKGGICPYTECSIFTVLLLEKGISLDALGGGGRCLRQERSWCNLWENNLLGKAFNLFSWKIQGFKNTGKITLFLPLLRAAGLSHVIPGRNMASGRLGLLVG